MCVVSSSFKHQVILKAVVLNGLDSSYYALKLLRILLIFKMIESHFDQTQTKEKVLSFNICR